MISPPPSLSIREGQSDDRWRAGQQNGSVIPGSQSSSTCRCGAWRRSGLTGSTRCARSDARINRHGEPVGAFICDGQAHPR